MNQPPYGPPADWQPMQPAGSQLPLGWAGRAADGWQPSSPMWWHRSAGHRAAVIALVVGFYLTVFPALLLAPILLLAALGR